MLIIPALTTGAAPVSAKLAGLLDKSVLPVLEPFIADLYAAARAPDNTTLARAYVALYRLNNALDQMKKVLGKLKETFSADIVPDSLELDQASTVKLAEGYTVTVSHKVRASVRDLKRYEAQDWLRDKGYGDIIKPSVNANTLSSLATTLLRDECTELPANLFNVVIRPEVRVTGAKKSVAQRTTNFVE